MDKSLHRRSISAVAVAIAALALVEALALSEVAEVETQQAAPIVLHTSTEQIPLKTYAEMMRSGQSGAPAAR